MPTTSISLADCVLDYYQATCPNLLPDEDIREFWDRVIEHKITSPPEQLFFWVWRSLEADYYLAPQYPIGRYRADFHVSAIDHFTNHAVRFPFECLQLLGSKLPRYAIEIDGFEWHDKTPEQAESDRRRERDIQRAGYTVIRFAAREVLRDPYPCVKEIIDRLKQDLSAIYAKFLTAL